METPDPSVDPKPPAEKSQHGGARPGAGRKPTSEKFDSEIADAKRRIADHLPALIGNLFVLAGGVTVSEIGMDGEERIYSKPPDARANIYLIDRILGKPTQAVQMSGPDGAAIPLSLRPDPSRLPTDKLEAFEQLLLDCTPDNAGSLNVL